MLHENERKSGLLCSCLESLGFNVKQVFRENLKGAMPPKADMFVHLGSSWSLVTDRSHSVSSSVASEIRLIEDNLHLGVPTIGVCFGAQLLAKSLGGSVHRNASIEVGWTSVEACNGSVVFNEDWFEWHYDGINVPLGVRVEATNPYGVQAFSGPTYLGVQFHPEFNLALLALWLREGGDEELREQEICVEDLVSQSQTQSLKSEQRLLALLDWFLEAKRE